MIRAVIGKEHHVAAAANAVERLRGCRSRTGANKNAVRGGKGIRGEAHLVVKG